MEIILWTSISLIIVVYFGYPLFLIIITAFKNKPVNKADYFPSVSLLIPAYNEEKTIQVKIENSLSLDYPKDKLEIIVISDASTDKTEDIVRKYLDREIKLIVQAERKGKMAALNKAVFQAKGEVIVFSDANTMYNANTIKMLTCNFNDKRIGCVCGNSKFIMQRTSSVELGFSAYMRYERFIWSKESQLHSLLVVDGAIYAMKKELFSPINKVLADDFVNPLKIAAKGYGVIYEPEAKAEEKVVSNIQEEFRRKIRVTFQGYKALVNFWRDILHSNPVRIFQYLLHKFLRWIVPFFLIAIFISNFYLLKSLIYQLCFLFQILLYILAFIGYILQKKGSRIKIFYIPFYFCLVNLASSIGLFKALLGEKKGTWEKAETTR